MRNSLDSAPVEQSADDFCFSIFVDRNAEDIRREEQEAQAAAQHNVLTPYDDSYTVTGKLLANSQNNYYSDVDDPISTCSCTCLGGTSCANHELLIDPGYHPADILTDTLSMKRASV